MGFDDLTTQTTDDLHRKLEAQILRKKKLETDILSIEKKIYAYETLFMDDISGRILLKRPDTLPYKKERKLGFNDSERPFSADLPR